jgi:hypothetical protein
MVAVEKQPHPSDLSRLMRVSEVVNTSALHAGERRFESYTRYQENKMVISPTVTLTGTYVLWLDAGGNDVGTYAIGLIQGLMAISYLVAIVLGLVVARLLP